LNCGGRTEQRQRRGEGRGGKGAGKSKSGTDMWNETAEVGRVVSRRIDMHLGVFDEEAKRFDELRPSAGANRQQHS
jgi:hypothetical protein